MFAFCNWQFKVKGFNENKPSDESILKASGQKITVSLTSSTKTAFALVSAKKKEFDFGNIA